MKRETISLVLLLFIAPLIAAETPPQADFVVATNGSDENAGTIDKPFVTLARARDAVRQLKAAGDLKEQVTVLVRGGTYVLKEPLVFAPEDSGTPEHRIVYAAYPGEKPVLSSGREITGWKSGEGKRWVADVPPAEDGGAWRFTQLFVNGTRMTRARIPDTDDWRGWWAATDRLDDMTAFSFAENTLRNWPNVEDVEINVIPKYKWQNQILPLKSVDEAARIATLATPSPTYTVAPNSPYRAENVLDAVNRPGTWALNTQTAKVTVWPEDGVDLSRSSVTVPALPVLIIFQGSEQTQQFVSNLTLRGFTFTQTAQVPIAQRDPKDTGTIDTNESAILLFGAATCAIEECRFVEVGGYGVRLKYTASRNQIMRNEFVGCGGGGILLTGYGPGTMDVNRANEIAGNHIHDCGAFYWHASGISGAQSGANIIAYNHIHDMPYAGVLFVDCSVVTFKEYRSKPGRGSFRWNEIGNDPLTPNSIKRFTHSRKNVIAYNTIHHVMQRLDDGAAVYLGFDGGNNVIRGNLVYSIRGLNPLVSAPVQVGIYLDAETVGEVVDENVVWDCEVPRIAFADTQNKWGDNVFSSDKNEPPEAATLRKLIAEFRKTDLSLADDAP